MPILALLSMSAFASLAFAGTLLNGGDFGDATQAWLLLAMLGLVPAAYCGITTQHHPSDY